ncbi:Protein kinase C signaling pathway involved MAPKK protein [Entomortierella chlamydospora]|uniref:Protein kinase C signaling pathway involved MAPKK protein n=1 Tax=Entomortierella chlamydospora TaxID=101097 RepID=A0A9P6T2S4_9FUNG|nr:Protein kinase C signaling pathway involved MAPKK protein [Mortierella sp. AD010]KAG0002581.1 Protein kinase C signaling pathway involved MAPKK protein [Entomortierella chlamydospora]KAG0019681.1 Protein kinase C signaling pathway involved MAPKK protein [Entomortierella chlamydospora]
MSLARSHARKMKPALHVQLNSPSGNAVSPSPAPLMNRPLMEYLERNPRDPTREAQYTNASGSDKETQSIRSIPETPGGTRGPDPLMNYTLRPEDMITLKKLGEGSAGTVCKVKHEPTGFVMARKHVRCDPNPDFQRLLQRELKTLDRCHSPWIVTFYGAYMEDDELAICMEYCEGGSMEAVYKRVAEKGEKISENILGKISEAVLNGLVYLHKMHHVIHRDLKPSNIVATMEGRIKLCDFGVSGDLVNSLAETFVGTSYYMAPERIQGGKYPVQSDVWSLGLTMIEIAQMKNPFPQNLAAFELLHYIVNQPVPHLPEDEPWTGDFRDFLNQCLIKDFLKRPTPEQIMEHPFIVDSSKRAEEEVDMKSWIQGVWDSGSPTAQTPKVV